MHLVMCNRGGSAYDRAVSISSTVTEADILAEIIAPDKPGLDPGRFWGLTISARGRSSSDWCTGEDNHRRRLYEETCRIPLRVG